MKSIFLTFSTSFTFASMCLVVLCQRYYLSCKVTSLCRHCVQNSHRKSIFRHCARFNNDAPMLFFSLSNMFCVHLCVRFRFVSQCRCSPGIRLTYSLNAWCFSKSHQNKNNYNQKKKCIFCVSFIFSLHSVDENGVKNIRREREGISVVHLLVEYNCCVCLMHTTNMAIVTFPHHFSS